MLTMKRTLVAALTLLLTITGTAPLLAAESSMKVVFEDSLYGGLAGALLGAATLAFTNNKSAHLENIGYGAAAGVIGGAGVGLVTTINRAMVEYDNGRMKLSVPIVLPDIQEKNPGQYVLAVKANLLRGTF
jgi:hypothetical protein